MLLKVLLLCLIPTEVLCLHYSVLNCSCGLQNHLSARIYGGETARESEFPWQVALFKTDDFLCGGSIINNMYILTAAHCFKSHEKNNITITITPASQISVILGTNNISDSHIQNVDTRMVQYYVIHQFYNPFGNSYDIALIKLYQPITEYSHKILPICLPPIGPTFENMDSTVAGWGSQVFTGLTVKVLKKTEIKIFSKEVCKRKMLKLFKKDIMICAASPGHDACRGDSGGPLIVELSPFKYIQVGIVSFGSNCGNYKKPGVYTRVNKLVSWIREHTKDATYCKY
ncbi:UNVERIFIED_CONTAM: hypothetical protein RMT77_003297 [Armadillidium vulgare]